MKYLKKIFCFVLTLAMIMCCEAFTTLASTMQNVSSQVETNCEDVSLEDNHDISNIEESMIANEMPMDKQAGEDADGINQVDSISDNSSSFEDFFYTILGDGVQIDKYNGTATQLVIPKKIEGYDVVAIALDAFANTSVTTLTVPSTVITMKCNSKSVLLNSNIEHVIFAEGIEKIPDYACCDMKMLKRVTVPNGVKEVGNNAFGKTPLLTEIILPESVEKLGSRAFEETVINKLDLPANLKEIGSYVLNGNKLVKEIEIPQTVTSMSTYKTAGAAGAFAGSEVEEIVFAEGIEKIPDYACCDMKMLKRVTVPNGVKEVGNNAFSKTPLLTEIILPESVEKLGRYAFNQSTGLKKIYWPDNLTIVGTEAFGECDENLVAYVHLGSDGMFAAISAGLLVQPMKGVGDDSLEDSVLVSEKSSYYVKTNKIEYGKYATYEIDYVCNEEQFELVTDTNIEVIIPKSMDFYPDFVSLDGDQLTSSQFTYNKNTRKIVVPVSKPCGEIKLTLKAIGTGKISTYAKLNYIRDGKTQNEEIDVISMIIPILSVECSDEISAGELYVKGFTNPSKKVNLYVDGEYVDSVTANKSGEYWKTITLSNGGKHIIRAEYDEDKQYCVSKNVNVAEKAIELTQFLFYCHQHDNNWKKHDLLQGEGKKTITINPAKETLFKVKFNDDSNIKEVYIVSTKNGQKKYLKAKRTSENEYCAQGYFDDSNHKYVPGQLGVTYVLKNGKYEQIDNSNKFEERQDIVKEALIGMGADPEKVDKMQVESKAISSDDNTSRIETTYKVGDQEKKIKYNCSVSYYSNRDVASILGTKNYGIHTSGDHYYYFAYDSQNGGILKCLTDAVQGGQGDISMILYQITIAGSGTLGSDIDTVLSLLGLGGEALYFQYQATMIDRSNMSSEEKERAKEKLSAELAEDMILTYGSLLIGLGLGIALGEWVIGTAFVSYAMAKISSFIDENDIITNIILLFVIDPSGYVYEAVIDNRLQDVVVTIYYKEKLSDLQAMKWNSQAYGQKNPLVTDENGEYAWDVPEGYWQVVCEKDGYEIAKSEWMEIPPEQTDINIAMVSKKMPTIKSIVADREKIVVEFSQYIQRESLLGIEIKNDKGNTLDYTIENENDLIQKVSLRLNSPLAYNDIITVTVPNSVRNYAGNTLRDTTVSTLVIKEPVEILMENQIVLNYEQTKTIEVGIKNYESGMHIHIDNSSEEGVITSVSDLNAEGKATLEMRGDLPGAYNIKLLVEGTNAEKIITVLVGDVQEQNSEDKRNECEILGHIYGSPSFEWSNDGKNCSIGFSCTREGCSLPDSHISFACKVTSKVKIKATCKTKGITEYIASYSYDGIEYIDKKEVQDISIDPSNHVGDKEVRNRQEATCYAVGYEGDTYCKDCNTIINWGSAIPKTNHEIKTVNIKVANYYNNGYTGDQVCSICNTMIVNGKETAILKLAKPRISSAKRNKKNQIIVNWKKISDATGYEIQYATNKKFRLAKRIRINKIVTKHAVIKNIKGKNQYYIRIRACKKDKVDGKKKTVYSAWSKTKKIKVK